MFPESTDLRYHDVPPIMSGLGEGLPDPFVDNTSGHFFYASTDGVQRLDLLLHLAPYSPLLVVTGKPGVGKTALLGQFVARANDAWRVAVVSARVDMDRDELLKDIIRGFELLLDHQTEYPERYAALIAHLRALRHNGHVPILLLDDAQFLSVSIMEMIVNLCAENDAAHFLSIIMFGTPQLQTLLASPSMTSLAVRVTHTFEISPFTELETGNYIRYRLRAAGAPDDDPFDALQINKIHALSGGIAGSINELARRLLQEQTLDTIDPKSGRADSGKPWFVKRLILLLIATVVLIALAIEPVKTVFFKSRSPATDASRQANTQESPSSLTLGDEAHTVRPAASEKVPPVTIPAVPEMASPKPEPQTALPLSPVTEVTPAPPVPETIPDKSASAPAPTEVSSLPPQKHATVLKAAKHRADKAVPAVHAAADGAIRGDGWVRAQPDDRFTIQLMALNEEKAARQFIESHQLQDKAAYMSAWREGQVLFTVIYGDFSSHAEAERAAKDLPAKLATNPWVRSFKDLHGQLDKQPDSKSQ